MPSMGHLNGIFVAPDNKLVSVSNHFIHICLTKYRVDCVSSAVQITHERSSLYDTASAIQDNIVFAGTTLYVACNAQRAVLLLEMGQVLAQWHQTVIITATNTMLAFKGTSALSKALNWTCDSPLHFMCSQTLQSVHCMVVYTAWKLNTSIS